MVNIALAKPQQECTLPQAKDAAEAAAQRFIKGGEIIRRSHEIKTHLSENREIESYIKGPSGKTYWVYSRVDAMCKAVVLRRTY